MVSPEGTRCPRHERGLVPEWAWPPGGRVNRARLVAALAFGLVLGSSAEAFAQMGGPPGGAAGGKGGGGGGATRSSHRRTERRPTRRRRRRGRGDFALVPPDVRAHGARTGQSPGGPRGRQGAHRRRLRRGAPCGGGGDDAVVVPLVRAAQGRRARPPRAAALPGAHARARPADRRHDRADRPRVAGPGMVCSGGNHRSWHADVLFPLAWRVRDRDNHVLALGPLAHREAPGEHDNWLAPLVFEGKRKTGGYSHSPALLARRPTGTTRAPSPSSGPTSRQPGPRRTWTGASPRSSSTATTATLRAARGRRTRCSRRSSTSTGRAS